MSDRMETDLLAELISQKHDILAQLRQLSRRQVDLIADNDLTKLLAVLANKQTLLSDLQVLDRRLAPFREQDPDQRVWRTATDRHRCRQVAQRCEALLGEIMIVEKQSEADLTAHRNQAAKKLQAAHTAMEARSAYTQSAERDFGGLDLSSSS